VEPQSGGEYLLTIDGGKQLRASRRHVCQLLKSLRGLVPQETARLAAD